MVFSDRYLARWGFFFPDCIDSLGMQSGQISDKDITASSALRVNYEPWLARLHSRLGEGGWCAGVC